MHIGFHTSIAGGFHRAIDRIRELGCDSLQIFAANPRGWGQAGVRPDDALLFRAKREEAGVLFVAVHTTYLINLSSPDSGIFGRSVKLFVKVLESAGALGADFVVTHLGSHLGAGDEFASKRVGEAFEYVARQRLGEGLTILIENSAGAGNSFGRRLEDIGTVIGRAERLGLRCGLCFDTCHGFAAGYHMGGAAEVDGLIRAIDKETGLENLKLIHLNDSKGSFQSRLDRHEHIGKGRIGLEGIRAFIKRRELKDLPFILETPKKGPNDDLKNLKVVKKLNA